MPNRDKDPLVEKLEARIRELEAKLASAPLPPELALLSIAGLEQKVIQFNKDLEVEYVNSAFAQSLRVDREKIKGAPLREVDRFPWGPGYLEVLIDLARAKKEPVSKDQTYYDQSLGREVYVRITVTPLEAGPQVVIEDRTELRALENSFRRYVSPQVLEQMKVSGKDFFLPERRSITVLFADLRGFTSMSEKMSPETVRLTVNAFLDRMIGVLQQNDATVDKIVGDEVMALFGAPLPCEDHALRAIRAAVEMQRAQAALMEEWKGQGRPMPPVGIGVNTGEMVVGNIGSEFRTDYTVLGHNVNVAARLCGAAPGGEILISQATFDGALGHSKELKEQAFFKPQRPIEVKGVSERVEVISVTPKEGEEIKVRRLREADKRRMTGGRRFFGNYEILEEIGRGGMAVVYRATHKDLGRIVALKMLVAGEGASETLIKRFQREAEATARLRHPNVITIHDVGVAEGHHYFTMELIEGVALSDLVRAFGDPSSSKGTTVEEAIKTITRRKTASEVKEAPGKPSSNPGRPLPTNQAVRILRDAARGVQHAHENGIIHRDLKPSNIMVTRDGRPIVLDFGLARGMGEEAELTKSGTLVGTIAYMSPEQAEGKTSTLDERSDIYSLGAVLYEVLTGKRAFEPTGNDAADASRLVTEEPPRPRKVNPRLDRDLETIVLKAMDKDRARRYPSAAALADDLDRYHSGEPVQAQPPSLAYRIRKKLVRHRAVSGVASLAGIALLGMALWYWTRPGSIDLSVTTPGSKTSVDGRPADLRQGRLLKDLPAGRYALRVEAPGHHSIEETLTVTRMGTERREITLRAMSGFLQLAADQPGTIATLTDPATGVTLADIAGNALTAIPLPAVVELREGPCKVRFQKLGFEAPEEIVEVPGGKATQRVTATLQDRRARVVIGSRQPGVQVHFRREGDTPLQVGPVTLPIDPENPLLLPAGAYQAAYTSKAVDQLLWPIQRTHALEAAREARLFVELDGHELWSYKTEDDMSSYQSSPALVDLDGDGLPDCVFGSMDKHVYALSGWSGRRLWAFEAKGEVYSSPATADLDGDGVPDILVGSLDKNLYAISGKTGLKLWAFATTGEIVSSPAVADLDGDRVPDCVVGSNDENVYAVSGRDGRMLWSLAVKVSIYSRPALADLDGDGLPDCMLGSLDNHVYAVSGKDGHLLWSYRTGNEISSSPALADLNVDGVPDCVIGSRDKNVYALSGKDGTTIWVFKTGGSVNSNPVLADLNMDGLPDCVVGSDDGNLYALSGRDGSEIWKFAGSEGWKRFTPAVCDLNGDGFADFVIGGYSYFLYAVSGADGSELWSFRLKGYSACDVALADLDGNRGMDLVLRLHNNSTVRAFSIGGNAKLWSLRTRYSDFMASLGDLNGDGIPDCVVGDGWPGSGYVHAISGKDGREIWSMNVNTDVSRAPSLADLNGDGVLDCVIAPWADGKLHVLSGRDGAPVWTKSLKLGSATNRAALADLDGDGVCDAVIGTSLLDPSWNPISSAELVAVSGKDGKTLWAFESVAPIRSGPVLADLDGDDVPECVFGSDDHHVYALSGSNGRKLWAFESGGQVDANPTLEDLDGDGILDCIVGSDDKKVYALSGKDGRVLWCCEIGRAVSSSPSMGDLDGDGVPDCVVGCKDGKVHAIGGRDGCILWTFGTPLESSIRDIPVADMDGDGVLDCVIGSRRGEGLYVLSGRDGHRLWSYRAADRVEHIFALADLDGDGRPEVIVSTVDRLIHALSGRSWRMGATPIWSSGHRAHLDLIGKESLPTVVYRPYEIAWQRRTTFQRPTKEVAERRRKGWAAGARTRAISEGNSFRAEGRHDDALSRLLFAVEGEPRNARAHSALAKCRIDLKQFDQARVAYETALELMPEDPELLDTVAWFLLTCEDEAQRDAAGALRNARKACDVTRNSIWYMVDTLALALLRNGRPAESTALQQQALELFPGKASTYSSRSQWDHVLRLFPGNVTLLSKGAWFMLTSLDAGERDLVTALAHARNASELDGGKDDAILDTFALALFRNGKVTEAADTQRRAIIKLRSSPEAQKKARLMEQYSRHLEEYVETFPPLVDASPMNVSLTSFKPVGKVGLQIGRQMSIYSNGKAEATVSVSALGKYRITVTASGGKVKDEFPRFKLHLDEISRPEISLTADGPTQYFFDVVLLPGDVKLAIEFTNDYYLLEGATKLDRNLIIHSLEVKRVK